MRRLALVVVVLLVVPASAVARSSLTRSSAAELARAVGLQTADLPDWNATPDSNSATEDIWGNGRVALCMGRKRWFGEQLADVSSPLFENPVSDSYQAIGSEVEVLPAAALVRKDLKLAGSARGRRCLAKELGFGNLGKDAKVVKTTVTKLTPAVVDGVGYRVKLVLHTRTRQTIVMNLAFMVFGSGAVEGALYTIGMPTMPDRAQLDQLFATMRSRVSQQPA